MRDPYLYPDVDIMKNKFGIKSRKLLQKAERTYSQWRMGDIDVLLAGNPAMDFFYCMQINHYLLQDVYEWAGQLRTIDMAKSEPAPGGASVEYAPCMEIARRAQAAISHMDSIPWDTLPEKEQAEEYAQAVTALWQTHPFRDGNTRSVMTFAAHYALAHGFSINRELIGRNAQYTRDAMALATASREHRHYITEIMEDAIRQGDQTYFQNELLRAGFEPTEKLVRDMRRVNRMTGRNTDVKTIRSLCRGREYMLEEDRRLMEQMERDFREAEKRQVRSPEPPQP